MTTQLLLTPAASFQLNLWEKGLTSLKFKFQLSTEVKARRE